jgi:hypothetical protein
LGDGLGGSVEERFRVKMNPLFLRALMASLPLLGLTLGVEMGLLYGAVTVAVLVSALGIFLAIQGAIPRIVHPLSFFLILFVGGVLAGELFSVSVLFLVSLCLLVLPDFFRPLRLVSKTLFVGFSFWSFLMWHALLSDLLGRGVGIRLFQLPAGSYLLMGFVTLFFSDASGGRKQR